MISAEKIRDDYFTDNKKYAEMIESLEEMIISSAKRGFREIHWYFLENDPEELKAKVLFELEKEGYVVNDAAVKYIVVSW